MTGLEDRQHFYVGMSRRVNGNFAYVFTESPIVADPAPGPRPAPELARYDRQQALRAAQPAPAAQAETYSAAADVLAEVVGRDGRELSATEVLRQNLADADADADADHLAILHAIWVAETTPHRDQRYRDLLMTVLPAEFRHDLSPKAKWLWRTLRSAELAGLDPADVLGPRHARR